MDTLISDVSAKATAQRWLSDLAAALASGDGAAIAALFADECYWRDILAFTWDLHTTAGAAAIAKRLVAHAEHGCAAQPATRQGPHAAARRHARGDQLPRGDLHL